MIGTYCIGLTLLAYAGPMPADYALETSDFMKRTAYRNARTAATDMAPSGAYGPVNRTFDKNHQGKWYIEEQRYGDLAIAAGIVHGDTVAIDRGLRAFEWGFRHQEADGSFNCPDQFHSMSFFVEATTHSCLLLLQSPYADRFRTRIDEMKPRIHAAAQWMIRPRNESRGKARNAAYAHRRYLMAAALGEAGVLCEDRQLVAASEGYIREGIGLQVPEGYNPEKGGYDSNYHAFGIVMAMRYYTIVADAETRAQLRPMLQRAVTWLATRVRPNGEIDPTGNTRTGLDQEKGRSGKPKGIGYGNVYRAFEYWYQISGDEPYHRLAELVAYFDKHRKRSR